MQIILPEQHQILHKKQEVMDRQISELIDKIMMGSVDSTYDLQCRIKKDFNVDVASNQMDLIEAMIDLKESSVAETDARSGGKTFGAAIAMALLSIDIPIQIGITAPTEPQANRIINTFKTQIVTRSEYIKSKINWKMTSGTRVVWKSGALWESFSGNEFSSGESRHYDMITCFPKGTKISMADGSRKNIEDVQDGDIVISCDMKTMQLVFEPIVHRIENDSEELIEIQYEVKGIRKTVRCTPIHRIITARGEFQAKDLKEDDEIYSISTD